MHGSEYARKGPPSEEGDRREPVGACPPMAGLSAYGGLAPRKRGLPAAGGMFFRHTFVRPVYQGEQEPVGDRREVCGSVEDRPQRDGEGGAVEDRPQRDGEGRVARSKAGHKSRGNIVRVSEAWAGSLRSRRKYVARGAAKQAPGKRRLHPLPASKMRPWHQFPVKDAGPCASSVLFEARDARWLGQRPATATEGGCRKRLVGRSKTGHSGTRWRRSISRPAV